MGSHDSINIRSYIDGKTKLCTVLDMVAGVQVRSWDSFTKNVFKLSVSLLQYPASQSLPDNLCESCFEKARDTFHFQKVCLTSLEQLLLLTRVDAEDSKPVPVTTEESTAELCSVVQKEKPILFEEIEEDEVEEPEIDDHMETGVVGGEIVIDHQEEEEEEELDEVEVGGEDENEAPRSEYEEEERDFLIHYTAEEPESQLSRPNTRSRRMPKRTFSCGDCERVFPTLKELRQHKRTEHGEEPEESSVKIYLCTKCMKKFDSQDSLRIHENNCDDLESIEKPFACNVCPQRFTFQKELKAHQTEHEVHKRFFCMLCTARFTRSSQVTMHMRKHTQEKPFECPKCQMCFSKKTNMVRHMQSHTNAHMYACSTCDKSFKWQTSLKVHMNTHNQERIYKCDECDKEYSSMSGYRKHRNAVHPESQ